VYAGHGFGSQHHTRLLFGLGVGATGADTLIVDWPSRKRSLLTNIAANQLLTVDEAGAIGVEDPLPPSGRIALRAVTPNPARGDVDFVLDIPLSAAGAPLSLDVYDAAGRRVAEIFHGALPAGPHRLRWSPRDTGARLAAGVYLAHLRAPHTAITRKIVLLDAE
jgi:hypothetical protein